jgi:hypothetical protein
MKLIPVRTGRRAMLSALSLIVLAFTSSALVARAAAQDPPASTHADVRAATSQQKPDFGNYQTFYLTNVTSDHDANEIVTDLRNMLPNSKIYLVQSQRAISIEGSTADIQSAKKILSDIERPRKSYRLTYSLTEMDGDKAVGTQKVSLIALESGDKTIFKQGSKVPIVTGTTTESNAAQNSQVQYEDVGLMIEAAVDGSADNLWLRTRVAQSSVSDERAASSTGDPSIRQTVLEGAATLVPGKPLVLGTLDIPGSTHREEISVVSELVD